MSSVDKSLLTLKILVTNFCRFQCFADFDFKIVLLGKIVSSQFPPDELSIVYFKTMLKL